MTRCLLMLTCALLAVWMLPASADGICPAVPGASVIFETLDVFRVELKCKYEPTGDARTIECAGRFNAGADGIWDLQVSRVNAEGLTVCKYGLLESHYLSVMTAVTPATFRTVR